MLFSGTCNKYCFNKNAYIVYIFIFPLFLGFQYFISKIQYIPLDESVRFYTVMMRYKITCNVNSSQWLHLCVSDYV